MLLLFFKAKQPNDNLNSSDTVQQYAYIITNLKRNPIFKECFDCRRGNKFNGPKSQHLLQKYNAINITRSEIFLKIFSNQQLESSQKSSLDLPNIDFMCFSQTGEEPVTQTWSLTLKNFLLAQGEKYIKEIFNNSKVIVENVLIDELTRADLYC